MRRDGPQGTGVSRQPPASPSPATGYTVEPRADPARVPRPGSCFTPKPRKVASDQHGHISQAGSQESHGELHARLSYPPLTLQYLFQTRSERIRAHEIGCRQTG
jgi:hypothetical protein